MIQPDLSLPNIPEADTPITNSNGDYVGSSQCQSKFSNPRPPVPYGQQVQNSTNALWFEDGFKEVVGYLTEGRYLVAEKGGSALTNSGERDYVTATPATDKHDSKHQRWVIHYTEDAESEIFTISSALDGRWLGARGALLDSHRGASAEPVRITFLGNGLGYAVQYVRGNQYIDVNHVGQLEIATQRQASNLGFKLFSVTYHD
jgi:phospholipase C